MCESYHSQSAQNDGYPTGELESEVKAVVVVGEKSTHEDGCHNLSRSRHAHLYRFAKPFAHTPLIAIKNLNHTQLPGSNQNTVVSYSNENF